MKKSWRSRCSVPWHGLSCGQVLITDQLLNIPVEMMDGQADVNLRSSLPGACLPGACFHLMARRFQGCQHWERLSLAREALILSHRTAASWASAGKPVRMPWGALLWAKDAPAALFEEEVPSPEPTARRLTIPPLVATMLTARLFRPLSQLPGKSLRFYDRGNGTRPEPLGRGAPLLPGSRRAFSNEVGSKAVLVTGCDSGFGFSLAKHLHSKGFLVFAGCLMKPWSREQPFPLPGPWAALAVPCRLCDCPYAATTVPVVTLQPRVLTFTCVVARPSRGNVETWVPELMELGPRRRRGQGAGRPEERSIKDHPAQRLQRRGGGESGGGRPLEPGGP
ncbi:D-beta-hydroxybutyrate dehydrogenase, mitochondrial isoform X8 [Canis aureus]